jgi:hypothetical protein
MLIEAVSLIFACFGNYAVNRFASAAGAGLLGLALATAAGIFSHRTGRSFNTSYTRSPVHYLLCVIVGLITWAAAPFVFALRYLEPAANASIRLWRQQVHWDRAWQDQVFKSAYEDIRKSGVEDFTRHPHPSAGGKRIPTTKPESIELLAWRYVSEASNHWRRQRPLLSRLLWTYQEPARSAIAADASEFLARSRGQPYPAERAIDLAAGGLEQSLQGQAPRLVFIGRALFLALVLVAQAVPLGIIVWKAQREVRPVFV